MLWILLASLASTPQNDLGMTARTWALANQPLDPGSDLQPREIFSTWFGTSVHLVQSVHGIEVHDAKLVVTFDHAGQVVLTSSSVARYRSAELTPIVSAGVALVRASEQITGARVGPDGPYGGVKTALFTVGDALHLGHLVFIPTFNASENWHVLIDATTGETLWSTDRVLRATLDAKVYAQSPGGLDAGVGVAPLTAVRLEKLDGGPMIVPNSGGFLEGRHISAYNCCINVGCRPDAGSKKVSNFVFSPDGGLRTDAGIPLFNIEICDRLHRATSNPATHSSGDFVYPPLDSPVRNDAGVFGPARQSDPSNSDEFAEVHAFFHINRMYEWIEGLGGTAQPFTLRDERRMPSLPMLVQTNFIFPGLYRMDNAFYSPRENYQLLLLPDVFPNTDALFLLQGDYADFAYDATIVRHEFGHAVIMATAGLNFATTVVGKHAASDERGTLHEAFADYLAAAFANNVELGPYAIARIPTMGGPSNDRSVVNDVKCPEGIWGESHRDSQPLSAALWTGRMQFAGNDSGRSFDAAVYASLVSMSPQTDAAGAAEIIATVVGLAFPQVPGARAKMMALLVATGAAECSRVVELTASSAPRPYYFVSGGTGSGQQLNAPIPGPYQLKLRLPAGSSRLEVTAGSGNNLKLVAKLGAPIVFSSDAGVLTHDAPLTVPFGAQTPNTLVASVAMPVRCGEPADVYFTLVNTTKTQGAALNLAARALPESFCFRPPGPTVLRALPNEYPSGRGCGCTAAGGPLALLLLLLLAARRRTMR